MFVDERIGGVGVAGERQGPPSVVRNSVSVVVAAYNAAPYIREAIESVLAQDLPGLDLIVVDDASTDGTAEVVRRFGDRVRLIALDNNQGGPAGPRNQGIKASRGAFIAFFDADDVMKAGKLSEQIHFLETHLDIPLVFTNCRNFSKDGLAPHDFLADHLEFHALKKERLADRWYRLPAAAAYETLLTDNFIGTSGVVFRRSLLDAVGVFDEKLKRSEDIEFWFRIARRFDLGYIDRVYHHRRLHETNISSSPAALDAKLAIYERQRQVPMSASARQKLRRMMGKMLFSIGYANKVRGHRLAAIRFYLRSILYQPHPGRPLKAIAGALLPS
jgi:glycosyltransferase involved in cell wall biosynthesis